jgi:hypothetical protein
MLKTKCKPIGFLDAEIFSKNKKGAADRHPPSQGKHHASPFGRASALARAKQMPSKSQANARSTYSDVVVIDTEASTRKMRPLPLKNYPRPPK